MFGWICKAACGRGKSEVIDGRQITQGALLADGGFAYVYRGADARTGEDIAVRRALLHDSEARQAAREEIALLEGLPHHEHVVRFLGAEILGASGSEKAEFVSIWELCTGGTLVDALQAAMRSASPGQLDGAGALCPCLQEAAALQVLRGMGGALSHLHKSAIVHYDVKSENLMLGADNRWKLGDFGSASRRTFDLTNAARQQVLEAEEFVAGRCTPMYRAPEIADVYLRLPVGPKVDVFASGCVLYATMTGTHPFPQDSQLANVQAKFRLPRQAEAAYSRAFATWVMRLLARDPAERPTAAALAAEVQSFAESRREPPSPVEDMAAGLRPRGGGATSAHGQEWKADFSPFAADTDTGPDR